MQARRNKFKPPFKAKVAFEALKGDKSIAELAQIYQVHLSQITAWKKQLLEAASGVFEGKHAKAEASIDLDALYREIASPGDGALFLASRPGVLAQLKKEAK
jgi:transposase-like protein